MGAAIDYLQHIGFENIHKYEIELKKYENDRKKIEKSLIDNKNFADMIEDYGLMVKFNDEEFCLTKDRLVDFDKSHFVLSSFIV